jgi:GH15 family glucan-1,4-alpha-glucosidase
MPVDAGRGTAPGPRADRMRRVSTDGGYGATVVRRTDGYAAIRDYAVIGNKRTAALVAADGSIDWLALPTLGGPSVFGALLDSERGGRATLKPTTPFETTRRYVPDTNVLETTFTCATGTVRVTDALSRPSARPLLWNQLIRRIDGLAGSVALAWSFEPRFDYGRHPPRHDRRQGVPLLSGARDVLAVQTFGAGEPRADPAGVRGELTASEGSCAVLALGAFRDEPLALSRPDHLLRSLDSTCERWRRWLSGIVYDGPWADMVRRSALALDLLADDATGAIAAAATMGLPERIGGDRNYDYRYAWVRDANLTLEAMLGLGSRDEVHVSLGWLLRTLRRTHPWLRPVYQLDGEPRLPWFELDLDGYRGSRPVCVGNPAEHQLQIGNYGDVLDMAHRYVADGHALGPAEARRLAEAATFLSRIWERPDSGIWELPQPRRYTQSALAAWIALDRACALAERGELPDRDSARWRRERARIAEHLEHACWSQRLRSYTRAANTEELDAAVLLAGRGAWLRDQPERLSATIDAIRRELGAGGPLLYRYTGAAEDEGAFLACSFWLVDALARAGRVDEAAETMDELVGLANDVGLFAEEIDPTSRAFLGNLPQALTHLSLINAALTIMSARGGPSVG